VRCVAADGGSVSLTNLGASFKAAEAEFAFYLSADLPHRAGAPYTEAEARRMEPQPLGALPAPL
jgi:hypothetical protein